jgi:hypothetical protein
MLTMSQEPPQSEVTNRILCGLCEKLGSAGIKVQESKLQESKYSFANHSKEKLQSITEKRNSITPVVNFAVG